jgi:serine/threonine protein phosphatase 1
MPRRIVPGSSSGFRRAAFRFRIAMRRAQRSRALRAALDAATIPTWSTRPMSADPAALIFSQAPARLEPGQRVYAVGDARGCLGVLRAMHAAIRADLLARRVARATLIHLGNLIDPRSRDSAAMITLLAERSSAAGLETVTLRGDHEQTLLDAFDGDAASATDWLQAGGTAALSRWGVPADAPRGRWAARVPPEHVAFLRGLPDFHRAGNYFFAHAGVRPGIPLARQAPQDLRGIRQVFLSSERDFGAVVVHGHSFAPDPVVLPNRIGLDTGAGLGGKLTCAVLEGDRIGFLSLATNDRPEGFFA